MKSATAHLEPTAGRCKKPRSTAWKWKMIYAWGEGEKTKSSLVEAILAFTVRIQRRLTRTVYRFCGFLTSQAPRHIRTHDRSYYLMNKWVSCSSSLRAPLASAIKQQSSHKEDGHHKEEYWSPDVNNFATPTESCSLPYLLWSVSKTCVNEIKPIVGGQVPCLLLHSNCTVAQLAPTFHAP